MTLIPSARVKRPSQEGTPSACRLRLCRIIPALNRMEGPSMLGSGMSPRLLLCLLAAVSARGAQLTVSTPLGQVRSIAVGPDGYIYVAGTDPAVPPTPGAINQYSSGQGHRAILPRTAAAALLDRLHRQARRGLDETALARIPGRQPRRRGYRNRCRSRRQRIRGWLYDLDRFPGDDERISEE